MLVRFGTPGYIPGLGEWIEYRWNKFLGGFDDDDGPPPASSSGENGEEDTGAGHDDKEKEAKAKMKADANAQFKARQQQLAKTNRPPLTSRGRHQPPPPRVPREKTTSSP